MKKGFTLIELLVVIAIIGILSGIVLTSLNSARTKATDTKVKAQLASMRAQAEMFYDSNSATHYDGVCDATGANSGLADLKAATPGAVCYDEAEKWAASAPLSTSPVTWYCVDSSGTAKILTTAILPANTTTCP